MKKVILFIAVLGLCLVVASPSALAQNKEVIQFSGLIVGGDSLYGITGVYVYVPRAGRGTTSNYVGYFSLPALVGDTVLIKAIGFKKKQYIIPEVSEKLSVVIEMVEDTAFLPVVEVFPWPTEQIFKEAFLTLQLPDEGRSSAEKNLSARVMNRMMANLPDDGSLNHRYFMTQQIQNQNGKFSYPTFTLLDPFSWARFLSSAKKGDLKRNEDKEYRKEDGEN